MLDIEWLPAGVTLVCADVHWMAVTLKLSNSIVAHPPPQWSDNLTDNMPPYIVLGHMSPTPKKQSFAQMSIREFSITSVGITSLPLSNILQCLETINQSRCKAQGQKLGYS